jgi:hypothetical protein
MTIRLIQLESQYNVIRIHLRHNDFEIELI